MHLAVVQYGQTRMWMVSAICNPEYAKQYALHLAVALRSVALRNGAFAVLEN